MRRFNIFSSRIVLLVALTALTAVTPYSFGQVGSDPEPKPTGTVTPAAPEPSVLATLLSLIFLS